MNNELLLKLKEAGFINQFNKEFIEKAIKAGFTYEQIIFLCENFSFKED